MLTHVTLLAFTGMTFNSNENHKIPVILSGEYLYFGVVGEFPIKGHYLKHFFLPNVVSYWLGLALLIGCFGSKRRFSFCF